jgi:hypothetical protein
MSTPRNGAPLHDLDLAKDGLDGFLQASEVGGTVVHLACLMPDHLRVLVKVREEGRVNVVGRAKSVTTRI